NATPELTTLVEKLGIPVVFTWNGKGAIAEDNPMCAGTAGWPGSLPGNNTAANADVVMSLGCRFTDWSASSYRKGVTFSIPDAKPDAAVVCIIGDRDSRLSVQQLAVSAKYDIPIVFLILNNSGYISVRDGQNYLIGRQIGSEFNHHNGDGRPYSVDFVSLAKSFGFEVATKVQAEDDIGSNIKRALDSKAPALVEVPITRDVSVAAAEVVGWW